LGVEYSGYAAHGFVFVFIVCYLEGFLNPSFPPFVKGRGLLILG